MYHNVTFYIRTKYCMCHNNELLFTLTIFVANVGLNSAKTSADLTLPNG